MVGWDSKASYTRPPKPTPVVLRKEIPDWAPRTW